MSAITSRGSRPGSTFPAMAHSDSPGCTVTDTVGVTVRPLAVSAALAGEFRKPARTAAGGKQYQRQADQDDPAAAGEAEPRRLAWPGAALRDAACTEPNCVREVR